MGEGFVKRSLPLCHFATLPLGHLASCHDV